MNERTNEFIFAQHKNNVTLYKVHCEQDSDAQGMALTAACPR